MIQQLPTECPGPKYTKESFREAKSNGGNGQPESTKDDYWTSSNPI